jgi:hypothetical protein
MYLLIIRARSLLFEVRSTNVHYISVVTRKFTTYMRESYIYILYIYMTASNVNYTNVVIPMHQTEASTRPDSRAKSLANVERIFIDFGRIMSCPKGASTLAYSHISRDESRAWFRNQD